MNNYGISRGTLDTTGVLARLELRCSEVVWGERAIKLIDFEKCCELSSDMGIYNELSTP